jgi:hypothetical protein
MVLTLSILNYGFTCQQNQNYYKLVVVQIAERNSNFNLNN